MKPTLCSFCQKPKANYECEVCQSTLCKACAHFLDESSFSFLLKKPADLSFTTYCPPCYDAKVAAPLAEYEETIEKAKEVIVFMKEQGQATRLMKRKEAPVTVTDCPDQDETLLRLAFFAVQKGYNSIIDVDIVQKKVKNGSHKAFIFSGTGVPYKMSERDLRRGV